MIITRDFIFHFESEDLKTIFEETFGENWQNIAIGKQRISFKNDSFALIYVKNHQPKTLEELFESVMLGFIFLNCINPMRNGVITTSATLAGLVGQTCLALIEMKGFPLTFFFEDGESERAADFPDYNEDGDRIIVLDARAEWCAVADRLLQGFSQNGWVYATYFDPTAIGEPLFEGENNILFVPTSLFLTHFDDFELEQF